MKEEQALKNYDDKQFSGNSPLKESLCE